jgi:glycosyltransferase involved in cell wall biosynthesis
MRILFCNKYNFPFSGTEVYLFELMSLLRAQGHEVALFAMADSRGDPTRYDQYFVPHLDFKRATGLMQNARAAGHAVYSSEARSLLRKMIADFHPDVAHVRNIYHHLSPSILWELKAQGIPTLYHLNDFKLLCPNYNFVAGGANCELCAEGQYWHAVETGCYQGNRPRAAVLAAEAYVHRWLGTYRECVDLFLAPSAFVKSKLAQYGWPAEQIRVLPHFQQLPDAAPPIQSGVPVLYFGRLSAEKGVDDLLHAMKRNSSLHLLIAGDGPEHNELQNLAARLKLENVQFLGHLDRPRVDQLISTSAFTILPSHAYETLGKTILESYAWGRPVIASDLGSRRELVDHGKTGLLYPTGDREALGDAIAFLAARPDVAQQMGHAGQERVRLFHSPEKHAAALLSLYAEMRSRSSAGAENHPARLRIAFIGGRGVVSRYSGIEAYYEETGSRLAARGHDVTVYCRNYFTPKLGEHRGMKIVRLPTIRSKHLETFVHTLLSTVHAMFQRYDVVHYQALGPSLLSFLPRLAGAQTVVTVQGLDWQRKKWGRFAALVLRLAEIASARFPNATITVSRTLQKHYAERHGNTIHIPNGTTQTPRRAGSRLATWGLTPDGYVLYLGRFSAEKNCRLLIETYERLDTAVKLVLAGGSSHSDQYVRELKNHASDRVLLLDWVSGDALQELLSNAAIFVLPSDLEGLSLALLDAMAAGVCVLASDIPENRELVDGVGFTFRPGSAEDLANKLTLLIDNPGVRASAAQAALKRIESQYLWDHVVNEVEKLYQVLVRAHPSSISEHEANTQRKAA